MINTTKIEAVIFDRDGVILDSESIHIESTVKALQELGIVIQEKDIEKIIGRNPDDYKDYLLDKYSFSYEEFRIIQRKRFYELLDSAPLFYDAISLINRLHVDKIPLALTTSAGLLGTTRILKMTKLENIFKIIVTKEDCTNRKPHPEPYLTTATKLGVNPKNCVVIEDTSLGVESAKSAGMKCIAIPNSFTTNQNFSRADYVANSAKEIDIELLNKI